MIIKTYDDGRMAEIIIEPASKAMIGANELVHVMTMNNITCAKITKMKEAKCED